MLATDQRPFEILNNLIIINNDRVEGYNYAFKGTSVPVLKTLFTRLTETSLHCIQELNREVYKLGGKPIEGAVPSVDFFKAWMEVMTAVGKNDHKAILSSCSFEEGVVIKTYEEALNEENKHITTQHHLLFNKHHHLLMEDHGKIKNLMNVLIKE